MEVGNRNEQIITKLAKLVGHFIFQQHCLDLHILR